jgi:hypothetical protein
MQINARDPQANTRWRESQGWRSPLGPCPWSSGNPWKRGKYVGARRVQDTRRAWATESTKECSWGSQVLNQQSQSLHRPVLSPLHICYSCWLSIWGRLLTVLLGVLPLLPALGTLFLLLGCLVQPRCEGMCLVLLYLLVPCSVDIPQRPGLFWWE